MSNIHELLSQIEDRLKPLRTGCEMPVMDIDQSALTSAINDANVVKKLSAQIEEQLRYLHQKLYGCNWNPDAITPKGHHTYAVARQPKVFDIQTPTELDEQLVQRLKDKAKAVDVVLKDSKAAEDIFGDL